jgi:hypothetical protein
VSLLKPYDSDFSEGREHTIPPPVQTDTHVNYVVQESLDHRIILDNFHYLARWMDYHMDSTREPLSNVEGSSALGGYIAKTGLGWGGVKQIRNCRPFAYMLSLLVRLSQLLPAPKHRTLLSGYITIDRSYNIMAGLFRHKRHAASTKCSTITTSGDQRKFHVTHQRRLRYALSPLSRFPCSLLSFPLFRRHYGRIERALISHGMRAARAQKEPRLDT